MKCFAIFSAILAATTAVSAQANAPPMSAAPQPAAMGNMAQPQGSMDSQIGTESAAHDSASPDAGTAGSPAGSRGKNMWAYPYYGGYGGYSSYGYPYSGYGSYGHPYGGYGYGSHGGYPYGSYRYGSWW
ncbi:hypothetical protein H4R24_003592 [Coemansia sp. RSA 988]|nr:hypothetical protein H4R24_003592 [Coemansia sp. RSA 988]